MALVCEVVGCARSPYDYRGQRADDPTLKAAIEAIAMEWPTYGYRRVDAQLRRQGWTVNHKRVGRLIGELGLQVPLKARVRKTTQSQQRFPRYPNLVQGLAIVRPDQVWVADITYIRLRNEFVYLAVIMDVLTRTIRGWQLGQALDQTLTLLALPRALAQHTPEIHHSDQGVQYAATAYSQRLENAGVQISMAEAGEAWQNSDAERLMRTVEDVFQATLESQDTGQVAPTLFLLLLGDKGRRLHHQAIAFLWE
jgi:transposase InsO family protein